VLELGGAGDVATGRSGAGCRRGAVWKVVARDSMAATATSPASLTTTDARTVLASVVVVVVGGFPSVTRSRNLQYSLKFNKPALNESHVHAVELSFVLTTYYHHIQPLHTSSKFLSPP